MMMPNLCHRSRNVLGVLYRAGQPQDMHHGDGGAAELSREVQ